MIEMEKVLEVLNTDEGAALISEYAELFLKAEHPDYVNDEAFVKGITLGIIDGLTKNTVPDGADTEQFILGKLKESIEELKEAPAADDVASCPVVEDIPPRPLPNGSRYLNPEEVNWLIKYDPKVKSSAERYVKWYRREHGSTCTYMNDDAIIETSLGMLYKLNRRDPSIVEQLSGAGPSFFKPYEEGTPEEIVTYYFDSSSGSKSDYEQPKTTYSGYKSTNSKSTSSFDRKAQLLEEKKNNQILGVIFLFVFWPAAIYFFYKASQIDKQINSL